MAYNKKRQTFGLCVRGLVTCTWWGKLPSSSHLPPAENISRLTLYVPCDIILPNLLSFDKSFLQKNPPIITMEGIFYANKVLRLLRFYRRRRLEPADQALQLPMKTCFHRLPLTDRGDLKVSRRSPLYRIIIQHPALS